MAEKIFYLDDEFHLCEIFREYMEFAGYEVQTFTDSTKAIASCAANPPAMIFIDYRLADATGGEVAEQLAAEITKVLVTGELTMPRVKNFDYLMAKPYKLNEVKALVQDHFSGHR